METSGERHVVRTEHETLTASLFIKVERGQHDRVLFERLWNIQNNYAAKHVIYESIETRIRLREVFLLLKRRGFTQVFAPQLFQKFHFWRSKC